MKLYFTENRGTDLEYSGTLKGVEGVTYSFTFENFKQGDWYENPELFNKQNDEVISFVSDFYKTLLKTNQTIQVQGYREGSKYMNAKGELVDQHRWLPMDQRRYNRSKKSFKAFEENLEDLIRRPENLKSDNEDSMNFAFVTNEKIQISFTLPFLYNPRGLKTGYRADSEYKISKYLKFLPYNSDHYCVMHCLYYTLFYEDTEDISKKSLNKNEEYMEGFLNFLEYYKLDDFYKDSVFDLEKIEELESRLETSICLYIFDEDEHMQVELYYRSKYVYDDIVYLVLLPNHIFKDKRSKKRLSENHGSILDSLYNKNSIVYGANVKDVVDFESAHCAVLKLKYFDTSKNHSYKVCKYCTKSSKNELTEKHLNDCRNYFMNEDSKHRVRNYGEIKNPTKVFSKYSALYRVPYAVFDFESKLDSSGRHVPISYAILYFNIFEPKRSYLNMRFEYEDTDKLLDDFLDDLLYVANLHHSLQSVDQYTGEIPEKPEECSLCYKKCEDLEFNHSHFKNDNLNQWLDCWVCKNCNTKLNLKQQGVDIYGHNTSRYDNNLFFEHMLNSNKFKNYSFTSKNESKFTKISCASAEHGWFKLNIKDSVLIIPSSLDEISSSWVDPSKDAETIKIFLDKQYKDTSDDLVNISFKKAVFPYEALNEEKFFSKKKPINKKLFYNTLTDTKIDKSDYETYLEAHNILFTKVADYSFRTYHDHYLLLDVVLLALGMRNFMNLSFDLMKVNPLGFLSASAFSYNACLRYNQVRKVEKNIVLPSLDTQLWLKKSVRGGFSTIFNRYVEAGKSDMIHYNDLASMYPSVLANNPVPYKHSHTMEPTMENLQQILDNPEQEYYYFIEVDIKPLKKKYRKRASIFPMFPENIVVTDDMISEDQKERYKKNVGSTIYKNNKLNTVTFFEKKNYISSANYLRFARDVVGYEYAAVHKIEVFHAAPVMKDYIMDLYKLKEDYTNQVTEFSKNPEMSGEAKKLKSKIIAIKLMLNGIYGFNLVNASEFSENEIIDSENQALLKKRVSSTNFKSMLVLDKKCIVNKQVPKIQLIYSTMIGSCILWESKLLTLRFAYSLYDWLYKISGRKDLLVGCMSDTDSYMYCIRDFKKLFESKAEYYHRFNTEVYECFDTCFLSDPQYINKDTHGKIGYFTDELKDETGEILEFCGLAAKVYSYITNKDKRIIKEKGTDKGIGTVKGKGIPRSFQRKLLNHSLYKEVVFGTNLDENHTFEYNQISARKLGISTKKQSKRLVSLMDLKYNYPDGIHYEVFG